MLTDQDRWDRAKRLVQAATGEEYGDQYIVMDMGSGIVEPGYSDIADSFWVTGNWNPKRFIHSASKDQTPLTNSESLPERLGNALEKYAEVETLWYDEWHRCEDCQKLVRGVEDSYSWTPYFVSTEYEIVCGDCADWDDVAEDAVNDPRYLVPTFIDLEAEGFEQFNGYYETGWHPGQNDDPQKLSELAHSEGWDEVVFKMNSTGQFDMRFNMFVRKEQ